MEHPILITWLNDFLFCPASIYFHNLYGEKEQVSFQDSSQLNGTNAHKSIDSGGYSTRTDTLCGVSVFCERYGLTGKIDIFYVSTGELVERKKKIKTVYDGYVFQLYAQYFSLLEMGYQVKKLTLRSLDDNKRFSVPMPEADPEMYQSFEQTISAIKQFDLTSFHQENIQKCARCIYEPLCSCSLLEEGERLC